MDTKSKKSKPFMAWLCFFLGLNLFAALVIAGVFYSQDIMDYWQDIKIAVAGDFKDSKPFRSNMAERLDDMIYYVSDGFDDFRFNNGLEGRIQVLSEEGLNVLYWANNKKTGKTSTNFSEGPTFNEDGQFILPEGYDYYLYFDGRMLQGKNGGVAFDVYRYDSGYRDVIPQEYLKKEQTDPKFTQTRALLAVKENIEENPYAQSILYVLYCEYQIMKWVFTGVGILCLLDLGLFILAFILRKAKREFDSRIARFMGWFWVEVKVVVTIFALGIVGQVLSVSYRRSATAAISNIGLIIAFIGCWWFYFILVDMIYNKKRFFTHNIITWVIKQYRAFERGKPFKKALMMRVCALLLAEVILVVLAVVALIWGIQTWGSDLPALIAIVLFIGVGLYLVYRYMRRYNRTLEEFSQIIDQTERMTKGDFSSSLSISGDSDFYEAAQNLNLIQQGVIKATEEKLKSERLKIELITNVSHDLKTPLTSIISYVDLLTGEEELPQNAKDYVAIISQKADRLKSLIQDIFDLSKVTSGIMDVQMEKLDLPKLIQQTLADMEDEISATSLTFRTQYPEEPVMIMGDGKKLYHVFQNLLTNVFKYALENSRVYVDVCADEQQAYVTLKNIANYEMNFREADILERFVRGDEARSTEGSGLGLAIAQGYVQAMGGGLDIKVDGDLFKVTLRFPVTLLSHE